MSDILLLNIRQLDKACLRLLVIMSDLIIQKVRYCNIKCLILS